MVLSKVIITLSVPIRWYWSYSPWSQLDVLGEVYPQIRAGMRCCRPPAAFDWLPRLLEIGIRELWIHPRSSPLHCSVDNVSGDFPPLPYPITRPLCPVRQTLYAIHSPPLDPQHSVLVKYSSLIFFKPPICSSSSQGHRVILWFNRGTEFLFMKYEISCFSQTPLREEKSPLLFCQF